MACFAMTVLAGPRVAPAEEKASGPKITYNDNMVPILREKCFSCHNPDKERGGLSVTTYARLMEGGSSGSVISPGDPDSSRFYRLVSHKEEPHMPPKSEMLSQEVLETIRRWIADGAPESPGSAVKAPAKSKLSVAVSSANLLKPDGPPPMPEGLSVDPILRTTSPGTVVGLAASPWAPLVALGGQKQVLLYHAETLELLGVLPFPEGAPHVLKFSRNASLLLAGGGHAAKSGRVVVWSVKTGERVAEVGDELDVVLAADVSADQSRIALGGPGKVVRLYSTADGQLLAEIRKHTDWIRALEFSPDGVLLATADRAGGLWIWEALTGREYLSPRGHEAAVTDLSWRSDSNVLATAGEDGTVRLWEMENGEMAKRWAAHGGGVLSVDFSNDGRIVSAGRDRLVKTWDGNGAQQRQFEPLPDIATAAVFSHDGARIIAGDFVGDVRVWTSAEGKPVGSLLLNPPTLAERIEAAEKDLEARRAEEENANGAAEAARKDAEAAASNAAAAAQTLTNAAAMAGAAEKAVADASSELEAAKKAVEAATRRLEEARKAAESAAQQMDGAKKAAEGAAAQAEEKRKSAADVAAPLEKLKAAVSEAQARVEKLKASRK